eukprot:CAMPEP_0204872854 /NCGR_PEP_ID=MMETSP1348-20121228/39089_1 /ASSEMBLY_ACC=CAM_ASM_000700 /TAXON_ID=215587 /ORGANISM="Aplanochytrium stocchinoi, Strain GSBS06" /LENGTH=192 /DNA_ID=CAMNT_0052027905 /DNA_START=686 /DNA_END=1264 /DNA_ORIENTATION=+
MVLIYPIGIVAIYSFVLRKYNKKKGEEKKDYEVLVTDLIYPYKSDKFWFEAYELLRKLTQTSLIGLILPVGVETASAVALNLSLLFATLLVYLQPYQSNTDFILALFSLFMLATFTQMDWWFGNASDCAQDLFSETLLKRSLALSTTCAIEFMAALVLVLADIYWFRSSAHHVFKQEVKVADSNIDAEAPTI